MALLIRRRKFEKLAFSNGIYIFEDIFRICYFVHIAKRTNFVLTSFLT